MDNLLDTGLISYNVTIQRQIIRIDGINLSLYSLSYNLFLE